MISKAPVRLRDFRLFKAGVQIGHRDRRAGDRAAVRIGNDSQDCPVNSRLRLGSRESQDPKYSQQLKKTFHFVLPPEPVGFTAPFVNLELD